MNKNFTFPKPQKLKLRLKDMLEKDVDEKYYLTEKNIAHYMRDFGSKGKLQNKESVCTTLQAAMGSGGGNIPIIKREESLEIPKYVNSPKAIYKTVKTSGYTSCDQHNWDLVAEPAEIIREEPLDKPGWHRNATEVISPKGICRCISTQSNNLCTKIKETESPFRIRKLTPKECWRLMGFDDTSFERAEKVISDTQLYKQAGNSIVVNVLEEIFKKLF